jgi:hypothetical protein
MVVVKYANPTIVPQTEHPIQYQLITLVVGAPTPTHNPSAETQARPFEFIEDVPSNFSAMCPFCLAGFYVSQPNITEQFGFKFTWCPECNIGKPEEPKPVPVFTDPFVNPFKSKQLSRCELDESITPIRNITNDETLTVAQKMARAMSKKIDHVKVDI